MGISKAKVFMGEILFKKGKYYCDGDGEFQEGQIFE